MNPELVAFFNILSSFVSLGIPLNFFNEPTSELNPVDITTNAFIDKTNFEIDLNQELSSEKAHEVAVDCESLNMSMLTAAHEIGRPDLLTKLEELWSHNTPIENASELKGQPPNDLTDQLYLYSRADKFRDGIRQMLDENPDLKQHIESNDFIDHENTARLLGFSQDEIIAKRYNALDDIQRNTKSEFADKGLLPDRLANAAPHHLDPFEYK